MANIRRGFKRIDQTIKGILLTGWAIAMYMAFDSYVDGYMKDARDLSQGGTAIAVGLFIIYKVLIWIGRGFFDDDTNK